MIEYYEGVFSVDNDLGVVVAIPRGISCRRDLFRQYAIGLGAPGEYFGHNWDSFNDCLMDLQWLSAVDVYVVHKEIPEFCIEYKSIYIRIIDGASVGWASERTDIACIEIDNYLIHRLHFLFPAELRGSIESLSC